MDVVDQWYDVIICVVISGIYMLNGFGLVVICNGGGISFYYFKGNVIRVEVMWDMVNDRGQIFQELCDVGLEQVIENVLVWNLNVFNLFMVFFLEGGINFYY